MLKFSNKTNNKASSCGMIGMLHAKMTSTGEKVLAGNKFNKTLEAIWWVVNDCVIMPTTGSYPS